MLDNLVEWSNVLQFVIFRWFWIYLIICRNPNSILLLSFVLVYCQLLPIFVEEFYIFFDASRHLSAIRYKLVPSCFSLLYLRIRNLCATVITFCLPLSLFTVFISIRINSYCFPVMILGSRWELKIERMLLIFLILTFDLCSYFCCSLVNLFT